MIEGRRHTKKRTRWIRGEIDPEDNRTSLQELETTKHRLETELKDTSKERVAWVGGYQHLQGVWTHKETEREVAKRYIKEMHDNLRELKETRRAWPERKQGYEAGLEDNTRRIKAAQGEIEVGCNKIRALIRGQVEAQEEEDQEEDKTQI